MKKTNLVFAPPALALCFLFGNWLRWIPSDGIGEAFGCFLLSGFCFDLWNIPFIVYQTLVLALFLVGRTIWKRTSSWKRGLLGVVLGYSPIILCATTRFFRYTGP